MRTQRSKGTQPTIVCAARIPGDVVRVSLLASHALAARQGLCIARVAMACVCFVSLVAGCGGGGSPTEPDSPGGCGPYPDQADSPWVLPYPVGESYAVVQGNCNPPGHPVGTPNQYAYDFGMTWGSPVVATADGVVVQLEEGEPNDKAQKGGRSDGNFVVLEHPNGLYSSYVHLEQWGVLVEVGDSVGQGQLIARAGSSGTFSPHLHFSINRSRYSIPATFRNTKPHPGGLVAGEVYTAEGY